jgi:hypothetical protein
MSGPRIVAEYKKTVILNFHVCPTCMPSSRPVGNWNVSSCVILLETFPTSLLITSQRRCELLI